jgi:hypothetical protein
MGLTAGGNADRKFLLIPAASVFRVTRDSVYSWAKTESFASSPLVQELQTAAAAAATFLAGCQ